MKCNKPNRHVKYRQPAGYYTQRVTDPKHNHALRRLARDLALAS